MEILIVQGHPSTGRRRGRCPTRWVDTTKYIYRHSRYRTTIRRAIDYLHVNNPQPQHSPFNELITTMMMNELVFKRLSDYLEFYANKYFWRPNFYMLINIIGTRTIFGRSSKFTLQWITITIEVNKTSVNACPWWFFIVNSWITFICGLVWG